MKLREYIKKNGFSVKGFAELANISGQTINNILMGKCPSLQTAVAIEKFTYVREKAIKNIKNEKGEKNYVSCEELIPKEPYTQKRKAKGRPPKSCEINHHKNNENQQKTTNNGNEKMLENPVLK